MTMKGPFRDFVPIGAQTINIRMPEGASAKNIHLLVGKENPQVQNHGANITVTVPSIRDHEVVAIDL